MDAVLLGSTAGAQTSQLCWRSNKKVKHARALWKVSAFYRTCTLQKIHESDLCGITDDLLPCSVISYSTLVVIVPWASTDLIVLSYIYAARLPSRAEDVWS